MIRTYLSSAWVWFFPLSIIHLSTSNKLKFWYSYYLRRALSGEHFRSSNVTFVVKMGVLQDFSICFWYCSAKSNKSWTSVNHIKMGQSQLFQRGGRRENGFNLLLAAKIPIAHAWSRHCFPTPTAETIAWPLEQTRCVQWAGLQSEPLQSDHRVRHPWIWWK